MHEFLLRTTTEIQDNGKFVRVRPSGAVIFAATDRIKRDKWMEILCVLADPRPRFTKRGKQLPSHREMYESATTPISESLGDTWEYVKDHWEPNLRSQWSDWQRTPPGQESEDKRNELASHLETTGIRSALGKEPNGVADLMDTWLWSAAERRQSYIVTSQIDEVIAYNMMSPAYEIENGRIMYRPNTYVDWENDPDIPSRKKDDIRDKGRLVHPDFATPIAIGKFRNAIDAPAVGLTRNVLRAR